MHTRRCLHGLPIARFNHGCDFPVMAAPAEFGSEGSASEFGSVYWFKKVMGSNIARARGLDNGLSEVAKQNYYVRRGLAFRQAKW